MSEVQQSNTVEVDANQLQALINQNTELKQDVIALVNVFGNFSALFKGGNMISAASTIMKLINDKNTLAKIAEIVPVVDKYTAQPTENNG